MISGTVILTWLLVTPLVGAALSLVGGAVIARLPEAHREEAASAPHHFAVGVGLFCLVLEVLLLVGPPVSADFRWTPDLAQLRLHVDRMVAIFLPVITLGALVGMVAQMRREARTAWEHAARQAPVLLGLSAALTAAVAADFVLVVFALGTTGLAAWLAASGGDPEQVGEQVLGRHGLGLGLTLVGVALAYVVTRDEYLPTAGEGMLVASSGTGVVIALFLGLGLGALLGGIPGCSWHERGVRLPEAACYLAPFAAACLLAVRLPVLLVPKFMLAEVRPLLWLPIAGTWMGMVAAWQPGRGESARWLWTGLGALALGAALAAGLGPKAAAADRVVEVASLATLAVGAVALAGLSRQAFFPVGVAVLGLAGVTLVGLPLALGAVAGIGGLLGMLLALAPAALALGFAGLWRSRAEQPGGSSLPAGLVTLACLALVVALQLAPGWLAAGMPRGLP